MKDKTIARKALAALTRLRQGCNPSKTAELNQFIEDSEAFPRYCEALSIPTDYGNATLDFLQRLSRYKGDGIDSCKKCGAKVIPGSTDPALCDTDEGTVCQVCGAVQEDVRLKKRSSI